MKRITNVFERLRIKEMNMKNRHEKELDFAHEKGSDCAPLFI
jgi:hypothetical protein